MIDNLELYILNFDLFGKNFPKSQKISPDAFVQIAMQLAYYRLHNKLGNTYESGSLRKFNLGRTDIIRTCSSDVAEFLKSTQNLCDGGITSGKLLMKAINTHRLFTNQVVNCESFDRHFLGLKLISLENNIELPDLYKDIAFQRMSNYHISSSQVSSKHAAVTSYGPGNFRINY
jgi:carnitine O-acetyltransferase